MLWRLIEEGELAVVQLPREHTPPVELRRTKPAGAGNRRPGRRPHPPLVVVVVTGAATAGPRILHQDPLRLMAVRAALEVGTPAIILLEVEAGARTPDPAAWLMTWFVNTGSQFHQSCMKFQS